MLGLLKFLLGFTVTVFLLALPFFLLLLSLRRLFLLEWFFDARIIINQKIVVFLSPNLKINLVPFENFVV